MFGSTKIVVWDDNSFVFPQLSFMRVQTPCRSMLCVHSQCFDATSWFSCMEQTTTWLCPVCEKVVNPDDLIVDGYAFVLPDNPTFNATLSQVL